MFFPLTLLLNSNRWLTLENNQLTVLPDNFSHLKSLTHLNLKNNCLTKFPRQLYDIVGLKYCYLNSNSIADINEQHLTNTIFMKLLDINDNPFPDDDLHYKVCVFAYIMAFTLRVPAAYHFTKTFCIVYLRKALVCGWWNTAQQDCLNTWKLRAIQTDLKIYYLSS